MKKKKNSKQVIVIQSSDKKTITIEKFNKECILVIYIWNDIQIAFAYWNASEYLTLLVKA